MNAAAMYQEIIMDCYRNPKNFGHLDHHDIKARDVNPSCGDVIEIQIQVDKDAKTIKDIRFSGQGCAISQAAMSMLSEKAMGQPLESVANLKKADVLEMLGIEISMMRLKCALLGLKVLKTGVYDYLGQPVDGSEEVYGN